MPDDLNAELAKMKHDHRQHVSANFPAPGICVSRCSDSQPRWPCHAYRAVAALEAALKRHRPVIRKQGHPAMCEWDNRRWPCPEVADITSTLTGQEASDGS